MNTNISDIHQASQPVDDNAEKMPIEEVEDVHHDIDKPTLDLMPLIIRAMSLEQRAALNLRLRRKIDYRLLPMMLIIYIMNYLDRNNIASARLAGLETDLNLQGYDYQVKPLMTITTTLDCH